MQAFYEAKLEEQGAQMEELNEQLESVIITNKNEIQLAAQLESEMKETTEQLKQDDNTGSELENIVNINKILCEEKQTLKAELKDEKIITEKHVVEIYKQTQQSEIMDDHIQVSHEQYEILAQELIVMDE